MSMCKRFHFFAFLASMTLLVSATSIAAQDRSGTYKWTYKNVAVGVLKIRETGTGSRRRITFTLRVEQSNYPCVGEIDGRLKVVSSNLYEYNPNRPFRDANGGLNYCRLTFAFSGKQVVVRENDCEDFHGARCNFEGKYVKSGH